MTVQTLPPQAPAASLEVRPEPPPPAAAKETKAAGPGVYWGDLLTLKFWLFCFGLMVALELIQTIYRLVLFLMSRSVTP